MAKGNTDVMHIGIGSHVVAVRMSTGEEVWRTKLKSTSYISIYCEGTSVFAGASGQLFCLDAGTGEIRWHNKLKGLGTGLIAFGSTGTASAVSAQVASQAAAQAAATAAIIAAT